MAENPRIEELRRRVLADPASIAFAALAEEYRRSGSYAEAIETCRTGLQRHPSYLSARVTLGRALMEIAQYDEARKELELVLKAAPENLAAIRGLAEIHERLGEHVEHEVLKTPLAASAPVPAAPPVRPSIAQTEAAHASVAEWKLPPKAVEPAPSSGGVAASPAAAGPASSSLKPAVAAVMVAPQQPSPKPPATGSAPAPARVPLPVSPIRSAAAPDLVPSSSVAAAASAPSRVAAPTTEPAQSRAEVPAAAPAPAPSAAPPIQPPPCPEAPDPVLTGLEQFLVAIQSARTTARSAR